MIKKLSILILFLVSTLSLMASAQENIKFKIIFNPKVKKGCKSASNKYVYTTEDRYYRFKLAFNKSSIPKEFLTPGKRQNDLEIKIYSFEGLMEKKVPLRVIPFKSIVSWAKKVDGEFSSRPIFPMRLRAPRSKKNNHTSNYSAIEFKNWNLIAIFYDKKNKRTLGTASYNLKLIPSKYNLYSKVENTSHFYSLPAISITKLFDNYDGSVALDIGHDANLSSLIGHSSRIIREIYLTISSTTLILH